MYQNKISVPIKYRNQKDILQNMNMLFLKLQVQVYKWKISDSGGR
jgi:hypothetical protein